jgi:hypothetical protein
VIIIKTVTLVVLVAAGAELDCLGRAQTAPLARIVLGLQPLAVVAEEAVVEQPAATGTKDSRVVQMTIGLPIKVASLVEVLQQHLNALVPVALRLIILLTLDQMVVTVQFVLYGLGVVG